MEWQHGKTGTVKEFLFGTPSRTGRLLHKHYGAPVVLLIDEYDTPLMDGLAARLLRGDDGVHAHALWQRAQGQ
jgi:hypothetical protein